MMLSIHSKNNMVAQTSDPYSKLKEEDFPTLSSGTKLSNPVSAWSVPINCDKLKNIEIDPQKNAQRVLHKNPKETDCQYFHRINKIFSQSTRLDKYAIFVITNGARRLKVAARNAIIARYLCQLEDYNNALAIRKKKIRDNRVQIYEQMTEDEGLYDTVMKFVDYNKYQINKAIELYCNSIFKPVLENTTWFDDKTTCVDTNEMCISKEKILL